ncbi:MAG: EAL domain-containing protein [Deltaproteobacteria bacterium]|nr:EAL domain-containing protein [Deltaproteobacteria bacterium]
MTGCPELFQACSWAEDFASMALAEASFDLADFDIDAPNQVLDKRQPEPEAPPAVAPLPLGVHGSRRTPTSVTPLPFSVTGASPAQPAPPDAAEAPRLDDGWPWEQERQTPAEVGGGSRDKSSTLIKRRSRRSAEEPLTISHDGGKLRIRLRLLLHAVITSGVALGVASSAFLWYQITTSERRTVEKLSTLGHVIAWSARASLALDGALEEQVMPAAQVMLDALAQDRSILEACLFTADARLVASHFRHDIDINTRRCVPRSVNHESYTRLGTEIRWAMPIEFQNHLNGTITVRAQTLVLREELARSGMIAAVVMCVATLVAFAATARFERMVSRPILALIDTAQHVTRRKDYSVRVDAAGEDEFGLLIDTFNRMLQQIQVRDRELERQRDQLDKEVQARRGELRSREQAEERIRYLAYYDVLTGLPNRQCLKERLDQSLRETRRHGGHVAVLFLDLDRFKEINDNFGHGEGDRLLRLVAERVMGCVRGSDAVSRSESGHPCFTVSRQGGDEFTVMLTRLHSRDDAGRVAERMLNELRKPFALAGREVRVGASIGIAVAPDDGGDVETLLKHADMAMYQAKQAGRDAYFFFSPSMSIEAMRRLDLGTDLRRAVEWSDFKVHYQPKVDLHDGRVTGLEALVRWEHPTRGFISPADFIPLAEDLGLIGTLGSWVLSSVCAQMRAWLDAGLPPVRIAVNVSSHQFADPHLYDIVRGALIEAGLPNDVLELEITESAMIQNPEAAVATLESLRALGIQVALDDFGTGYSSLNYVGRLPLDALKIDRSFVMSIADSEDGRSIVTAVVAMAHSLGLRVVAEGVETIEQARVLRRLRCDEIQGYLFSRPVPDDRVGDLLDRRLELDELEARPMSGLGTELRM